jgi:hypothetical protein
LKTLFFVLVALAALGCVLNRTREAPDRMDEEGDLTEPDLTVPYFPPGHASPRGRTKRERRR